MSTRDWWAVVILLLVLAVVLFRGFARAEYERLWTQTKSAARWFLESKFLSSLVVPLVMAIPALLIGWSEIEGAWPQPLLNWIKIELKNNPNWRQISVASGMLGIVGAWILAVLRDFFKERNQLTEKQASFLLNVFENVVGPKMLRFATVAQRLETKSNGSREPAEKVFEEITMPMEQIKLLVTGIHNYFATEVESLAKLRVVLFEMNANGNVVSPLLYLPHGNAPRTAIQHLQGRDSAVNRCAEEKEIKVIEDIAAEVKRGEFRSYAPGSGSRSEGSIICYPVRHLDTVPYVISIKYPKPHIFTRKDQERYELVLQRFANRIAMEHSLLLIREGTLSCAPTPLPSQVSQFVS